MSIPRPRRVLTALALTAALTAAAVPAFADDPGGHGDRSAALERARTPGRAIAALDRAQAVFAGTPGRPTRAATLALRDLHMLRSELPADLQPAAAALAARPVGTAKTCGTFVCVHYVTAGDDAPNLTDGSGNGHPDYVDTVLSTMEHVHQTYVAAGYRAPRSDLDSANNGGDARTDVYIENLGDDGLYGYCNSDDPKQDLLADPANDPTTIGWDTSAFCALDDDYSAAEFPTNSPLENLQVTAAHEYFHAVQFAYDRYEDSWIMEATATWSEDEVYDGVDDNHNYNGSGPIAHPTTPLDSDQNGSLFKYGAWTFFRFLTEKIDGEQGDIPTLVRNIWQRLDGSVGGPDRYSLQAVQEVLGSNNTSLAAAFAGYSLANRAPGQSYEEGAAYPTAPAKSVTVSSRAKNPAAFVKSLDHLTSSTVRYRPSNLGASNWRLRLKLNLAPKAKGSAAAVTVVRKNGTRTLLGYAKINAQGDATVSAPFSSGSVAAVEVTLLNLSGRLDGCWDGDTPFSCAGGNPLDDNLKQIVDPVAYRP